MREGDQELHDSVGSTISAQPPEMSQPLGRSPILQPRRSPGLIGKDGDFHVSQIELTEEDGGLTEAKRFISLLKTNPTILNRLAPPDIEFLNSIAAAQSAQFLHRESSMRRPSIRESLVKSAESVDTDSVTKDNKKQPISVNALTSFSKKRVKMSEIRFINASYMVLISPRAAPGIKTVATALRNIGSACVSKTITTEKKVLNTASGIITSGSMTMVMGAPGSGKTSLLKLLSGRLSKDLVKGDVTLNGRSLYRDTLLPQKCMAFISSNNTHLYNLTVRETFMFALQTAQPEGGGQRKDTNNIQSVNAIIDMLGLRNCADTPVGDDLNRGVSGGERRRVTVGEMLAHGRFFGFCMDEISTGLDSATTFDICDHFRGISKALNRSFVISLLQPSQQVFQLFDNILLLSKGYVVYHGPREKVINYFSKLRYDCPLVVPWAEFLQEVCGPTGARFRQRSIEPHLTSDEFALRFRESRVFKNTADLLQQEPLEFGEWGREHEQEFTRGPCTFFGKVLYRELTLCWRDARFNVARFCQCLLMGTIVGSIFFKLDLNNFASRFGYLFNSCMFLGLGSLSNLPVFMANKDIFFKQRHAAFFPTAAYLVSLQIASLPIQILEVVVYGGIGFDKTLKSILFAF
jgi:ABC-type multidrug transport system ATPase subunit